MGGDRRGEETAGQVKGHMATITCHLQGIPEKGSCPKLHDYPAKTPSLRKKGLKDLDRKSFPYSPKWKRVPARPPRAKRRAKGRAGPCRALGAVLECLVSMPVHRRFSGGNYRNMGWVGARSPARRLQDNAHNLTEK